MGFKNATKKARVVSTVIKSSQTKLPPRLQWTALGSLVRVKTPRVRAQKTKIILVKRERKKVRGVEQRIEDRWTVGSTTQSYPSYLYGSKYVSMSPSGGVFPEQLPGPLTKLVVAQIKHITTRTCLDSGLSGVVDSVIHTLGAPE